MSNYKSHAMTEFRAAGWVDDRGMYCDEMQKAICEHVLKLLEVFDDEGHSGSSAPYAINVFKSLASFEPLVPLTGEDWEWVDVSEYSAEHMWYQNKRCGHVFKDADGRAYDSEGKIFWEWWTNPETGEKSKSHYTSKDSRVYIEFPYTPTREYVERVSGAE
jgi:hypothetical protein